MSIKAPAYVYFHFYGSEGRQRVSKACEKVINYLYPDAEIKEIWAKHNQYTAFCERNHRGLASLIEFKSKAARKRACMFKVWRRDQYLAVYYLPDGYIENYEYCNDISQVLRLGREQEDQRIEQVTEYLREDREERA